MKIVRMFSVQTSWFPRLTTLNRTHYLTPKDIIPKCGRIPSKTTLQSDSGDEIDHDSSAAMIFQQFKGGARKIWHLQAPLLIEAIVLEPSLVVMH